MELEGKVIVEELNRICASKEFVTKPVIKKFLTYLITEYVEGRSDQLKGYTIGLDVFDLGKGFDPDQNPLVRINAGRLRRLLKMYYLEEGKNDLIQIDIPKGTYCPVITKRNEDSLTAKSKPHFSPAMEMGDSSIAVLPFKNISNNKELDFLAYGFARDLSDALTKFDDLRVVGASKGYDDNHSYSKTLDQLRNKGVGFLIDGDIKAFGKNAKISFRLINVSNNAQLWVHHFKFDLENDDLFETQEKITQLIAGHVGGAFGPVNRFRYRILKKSRPNSLNEQDVLLKFYHHIALLTRESAAEFHKVAFEALEKEPESALLNSLVGSIYTTIYSLDFPGADEAFKKAGPLIEKAYAINPDHSLIRSNLATKCFFYDERERFFELVNRDKEWIANSSIYLGAYAHRACTFGEWELGIELLDRVFDNNLYVALWLHGVYSLYYYRKGDYEKALESANKYQIPGLFWGPIHRLTALSQLGRLEQAEKEYQALLKYRPDFMERGRYLMRIQIKDALLFKQLLEGFEKIGVELA